MGRSYGYFTDRALLGMVVLLMGADGAELTTRDLPFCDANTYLVYHQGKFVCQPTLPDCPGQLLTAGPGGDLSALGCTPLIDDALTDAELQHITDLQTQTQTLLGQLAALGLAPALLSRFVGITVATTTGRIESPGVSAGLPAANARCAGEFGAGAHLCSAREMLGGVLKHRRCGRQYRAPDPACFAVDELRGTYHEWNRRPIY